MVRFGRYLQQLDKEKVWLVEGLYLLEPNLWQNYHLCFFLNENFNTAAVRRRLRNRAYAESPPDSSWMPETDSYFEHVAWPAHRLHYADIYDLGNSSKHLQQKVCSEFSVFRQRRDLVTVVHVFPEREASLAIIGDFIMAECNRYRAFS